MMKPIRHYPMMNYRKYETEYSTLNNCDVTYVCTTDLGADNIRRRILPILSARDLWQSILGLFRHPIDNSMRIMNADSSQQDIWDGRKRSR